MRGRAGVAAAVAATAAAAALRAASGPAPASPANNEFRPGFSAALMNKDLGLAMDAVASTGSSAPLGTHAAELYAAFAQDNGGLDFSAIIQTLR